MIAITMTAHVEELVFGPTRRLAVELVDLVFETLPLGQVLESTAVGWICAVDEAKLHPILCKHLASFKDECLRHPEAPTSPSHVPSTRLKEGFRERRKRTLVVIKSKAVLFVDGSSCKKYPVIVV